METVVRRAAVFNTLALSNIRIAGSDVGAEREREDEGNSAVASNSVYPLWKEEDRVQTLIMDNKTDRRTAELSADLQH